MWSVFGRGRREGRPFGGLVEWEGPGYWWAGGEGGSRRERSGGPLPEVLFVAVGMAGIDFVRAFVVAGMVLDEGDCYSLQPGAEKADWWIGADLAGVAFPADEVCLVEVFFAVWELRQGSLGLQGPRINDDPDIEDPDQLDRVHEVHFASCRLSVGNAEV